MRPHRRCSRSGCAKPAVATLTYVYADSTAVVGPLAAFDEPHSYDLCEEHAIRLTAPLGWDLMRAEGDLTAPGPSSDDILALADAVREAARPAQHEPGVEERGTGARPAPGQGQAGQTTGRRGHLRVLPPTRK
ncbi:MAG: DUF3499 domain-containing protein [Micromonosporaceae bacterium]